MICTLIEKSNWKRQIQYEKEEVKPSFWIRQWYYVNLSSEKIEEIKNAKTEEGQDILSKL